MKQKKARILKLLALMGLTLVLSSNEISAQYSEVAKPITKEDLAKAELLLKPKVNLLSFSHLGADHCYHPTLGAFCLLENKIEKQAKFPVKMRLGSVDYVDKLEQKRP